MPKLPHPRGPLPAARRDEIRTLRRGTRLYRVYRAAGLHPSGWNTFRQFGPLAQGRFDHHLPPLHAQLRGILYAAGSLPTALVEAFGATRMIEAHRDEPWLAGFELVRRLRLLDLSGHWPTRAGASQAISSGPKDVAREWARAIYEEYDVDGIWYPASMSGTRRTGRRPRWHGYALALFERAAGALPPHPSLHLPLAHPALTGDLGVVAEDYGYRLIV